MKIVKEEIPILYRLIDFRSLGRRKGVSNLEDLMRDNRSLITNYWEKNLNRNLGQVLYDLKLTREKTSLVMTSNHSIFSQQGILPREHIFIKVDGEDILLKHIPDDVLLDIEAGLADSNDYLQLIVGNELCRREL